MLTAIRGFLFLETLGVLCGAIHLRVLVPLTEWGAAQFGTRVFDYTVLQDAFAFLSVGFIVAGFVFIVYAQPQRERAVRRVR
jgi:hypothetical protein